MDLATPGSLDNREPLKLRCDDSSASSALMVPAAQAPPSSKGRNPAGHVNVLRDAMAVDSLDSCGIYFGTTGGQVYVSADAGDNWMPIVRDLPAVLSVEVQMLAHVSGETKLDGGAAATQRSVLDALEESGGEI